MAASTRPQVEPDSFAFGNTIVATIQTGRFVNGGGANNIALGDLDRLRAALDDGHAAGHDGQCRPAGPVGADQRPIRRL